MKTSRRSFLAASGAGAAPQVACRDLPLGRLALRAPSKGTSMAVMADPAIRSFRVDVPQEALDDLRRRLDARCVAV